jgi:hypothetical protein
VTERKPPGVEWQTWIDRQIEQGRAQGAFDDLPGHGEPLPGIDGPHDELWWVREKLKREGVEHLPPSLAIRRDAARAEQRAMDAPSEAEVRGIIGEINEQIRRLNRSNVEGPPTTLMPFDVDEVVERWRQRPRRAPATPDHPTEPAAPPATPPATPPARPPRRRRARLLRWFGRSRPTRS